MNYYATGTNFNQLVHKLVHLRLRNHHTHGRPATLIVQRQNHRLSKPGVISTAADTFSSRNVVVHSASLAVDALQTPAQNRQTLVIRLKTRGTNRYGLRVHQRFSEIAQSRIAQVVLWKPHRRSVDARLDRTIRRRRQGARFFYGVDAMLDQIIVPACRMWWRTRLPSISSSLVIGKSFGLRNRTWRSSSTKLHLLLRIVRSLHSESSVIPTSMVPRPTSTTMSRGRSRTTEHDCRDPPRPTGEGCSSNSIRFRQHVPGNRTSMPLLGTAILRMFLL